MATTINMQQQLLSYTALFGVSAIALGPTISPFLLSAVLLPALLHLDYRSLLRVSPVVIAAHFAASLSTALPLLRDSADAVALQAVWSVLATCGLLVPIAGRAYIAKKGNLKSGDWNELMLFPLLWTTALMVWQQVSPFGRLSAPSPSASDLPVAALPVLRHLGRPGVDFYIGCFASLAYTTTRRYLSIDDSATRSQRDLLGSVEEEVGSHSGVITQDQAAGSGSKAAQGYNTFATPSFSSPGHISQLVRSNGPSLSLASILSLALLVSGIVLAPSSRPDSLSKPLDHLTPLTLACILPEHPSTLKSLIADSTRMASQAKILVWPETAVHLGTVNEREEVLEAVESLAKSQGVWIAAGLSSIKDTNSGDKVRRRNEVVLVGPKGIVGSYEKRKLVPLIESYAHDEGADESPAWNIELPPPAHVPKSKWTAEQPHLRSVSVSPLICLDAFHAPTLLSDPSFLLLPASSPSSGVAELLLAQARTLSITHDTTTLMCDGAGSDALSALIDPWGRDLHQQSGGGSFPVHSAVGWDGQETVHLRTGWDILGASGVLGLLLAFAAAGSLATALVRRGPRAITSAAPAFWQHARRCVTSARQALRLRSSQPEQQSLIDAD